LAPVAADAQGIPVADVLGAVGVIADVLDEVSMPDAPTPWRIALTLFRGGGDA